MHALWALTGRVCRSRTPTTASHRNIYQTPTSFLPAHIDAAWLSAHYPETDPRALAGRSKLEELLYSLSRPHANPSRIWNVYLELGSVMGFEFVPFEIQQQVLQKCVPGAEELRHAAGRRLQTQKQLKSPHFYESRLQTLIGHMRASGQRPTLDDYNFVLEQFAAVGHQTGSRGVFRELVYLGLEPSKRTYGLCFQAIAHRLSLPCPYRFRPNMRDDANSMCIELLDDMWARRIPMTSVNFDLALRVLKETETRSTFEKLLQVAYGIDLANPDRPPLDMSGPKIFTGGGSVPDSTPRTIPFSTAALNTLIDLLGSTKQISRMVMAFEVFTNPIHPPPSTNSACEDEDDEPAFYQFSSPDSKPYQPPFASPNTTTFNLLIRHVTNANHAVFARHYVVQAMELERQIDSRLRSDLASKPLDAIASPNCAVNRGTLLPPFGFANRTRHVGLLRWCCERTVQALHMKKEALSFYTEWRQKHLNHPSSNSGETQVRENLAEPAVQSVAVLDDSKPSTPNVTNPSATNGTSMKRKPSLAIPELSDLLLVDLDASSPPTPQWKPLDLDVHISLLSRDVQELDELAKRMTAAVERLSQRVKERLGRRVWQGKDIFLISENARVHVTRKEWMEMVRFRTPRKGLPRIADGAKVDHLYRMKPPTSETLTR